MTGRKGRQPDSAPLDQRAQSAAANPNVPVDALGLPPEAP